MIFVRPSKYNKIPIKIIITPPTFMSVPEYFTIHLVRDTKKLNTKNGTEKPKDRKSTRLNSSHVSISYAVFCLKKKTKKQQKKQLRKNTQTLSRRQTTHKTKK